ncbi:MAG TPA: hypothetical protein VFE28_04580, partial [Candidatus Krumholzibacteria bacterium]|nr:hypothetical protein [Candidatus Krumholzibacteria bacterium]
MRWDPWTGLARLGSGGRPESGPALSDGAARAAAATLLQDHGALWGADRVELVQVRWRNSGPAWHATWEQHLDGGPLRGAFLDLTLGADGHLVAFRSTLLPNLRVSRHHLGLDVARRACETLVGSSLSIEASEEIVAVRPLQRYEAFAALELTLRSPLGARWRAMVDAATGSVAALESLLRTEYVEGTTTGTIKPLYEHDPLVNATFPWLLVRLGDPSSADSTASDAAGSFALSANPGAAQLEATLAGLYVTVDNEAPRGTSPRFSTLVAVPGTAAVHLTSDHARDDERSIYVHANIIHDYARRRFGFSQLDYPVPAVASVRNPSSGEPNYSNAFWDGQRMGFGVGGSGNFGLFADVVYHEYTHAITDVLYRPVGGLRGTIGAAIHEALSDYFACTLTDEPRVGEYLGGLAGFRNLDNELVWPEDRHPGDEEHANGEILGGALWHVRTAVGAEVADRVIHFARELFPQTFDEYLEAILLEDDLLYGDSAPGNGSPHREAILAAFGRHGIGPLVEQEIRIVHTALHDTEDAATARRVSARHGSRVVEGMRLHWSTGGDWTVESMQADPAGGFTALLPGQADGTMVSYYLTAYRTRPYEEQRLPATAPAAVFSYRVGVDHEAPHLEHAPLVEVPAFGWPAELHVRLQDNLGVAYAY